MMDDVTLQGTLPGDTVPRGKLYFNDIMSGHRENMKDNILAEDMRHFDPRETAALLFDGPNFYGSVRALNFRVDYRRLFDFFHQYCRPHSYHYFSGVSNDEHHATVANLLAFLRNNGVRVYTKESVFDAKENLWKANMDVDIACVALTVCRDIDHIVLASGDRDFVPLVKTLQQMGKKVTILSSKEHEKSCLSTELRQTADGFIDLAHLRDEIQSRKIDRSNDF